MKTKKSLLITFGLFALCTIFSSCEKSNPYAKTFGEFCDIRQDEGTLLVIADMYKNQKQFDSIFVREDEPMTKQKLQELLEQSKRAQAKIPAVKAKRLKLFNDLCRQAETKDQFDYLFSSRSDGINETGIVILLLQNPKVPKNNVYWQQMIYENTHKKSVKESLQDWDFTQFNL